MIDINQNSQLLDLLVNLGQELLRSRYNFHPVTPATHQKVVSRGGNKSSDQFLRNFFGWNYSYRASEIPEDIRPFLEIPGFASLDEEGWKSNFRAATWGDYLFFHSSYPTEETDAVFFGPDTYRFLQFLKTNILPASSILDLGCGSGAGGLCYQRFIENSFDIQPSLTLTDINPSAIKLSEVNARVNGFKRLELLKSNLFDEVTSSPRVVVCNPPFIVDPLKRDYRNGGGAYGTEFSVKVVEEFLNKMSSPSTLLLYTGTSIVKGEDVFHSAVLNLLKSKTPEWSYTEIDPDIFGEQLESTEYKDVERIAAVGLVITK